jgi:hypothetical protein
MTTVRVLQAPNTQGADAHHHFPHPQVAHPPRRAHPPLAVVKDLPTQAFCGPVPGAPWMLGTGCSSSTTDQPEVTAVTDAGEDPN